MITLEKAQCGQCNQREENIRKQYKLNLYYVKGLALMHISYI